MLSHLLLFSELLNFNGPLRDRPLLASGEEGQDYNGCEEDNRDDEDEAKPHVEEVAVIVRGCSSIEEHFIEHLPPTLHRGNLSSKCNETE